MNQVLFFFVLMFGVFVQALVGFGGTLLSMPLGIMLMGMGVTKPVMTTMAWLTGVSSLVADYKYIHWPELLKMTAVMLVGVFGSMWIAGKVELNFLLIIYAVVVAAIGAKKLFFPSRKEAPKLVQNGALAIAGLMQGLFVSGGSFLAVYAVARFQDKRQFRATVNAVWGIINIVMIVSYFFSGAITRQVLVMSAIGIVPSLAAIYLGGVLSKYVKQQTFLKVIYLILIVSGLVLLITNL